MYHLNTFHLPKVEGVNQRAVGERIQKTTKTSHEFNKILNLT